jgi:hypothetical protein
VTLPPSGWLEEETVRRAKEGDREAALSILDDVAGHLECGQPPHPAYSSYIAEAFREIIEHGESADMALSVAKRKGRPPKLWESNPLLTLIPQIMNPEKRAIAIAEAVEWERRRTNNRKAAIETIADKVHLSFKAVEADYDKRRDFAEATVRLVLREDT